MPSGRRMAGLAMGVLTAFAMSAVVVSRVGLGSTELAQAAAKTALPAVPGLATKPADQAETKKLFAYLSADSYTPEDEKGFLANRLGVDDKTKNSQALKERQAKKGKRPVQEEKEPNYDVPYFSKFLLPPPPHFTRGGMHAAAAQSEQARAKAGLVDDDGVHYLGKDGAEKLSKELGDTEQKYLKSENHGIVWQSAQEKKKFEAASEHTVLKAPLPIKHLDRAQDKVLARDLEAGIAYATLPNHGVPVKEPVEHKKAYSGVVTGKAGVKLAEELEAGEQEALSFEAAEAVREERVKKALHHEVPHNVKGAISKQAAVKLAADLMEGQREALLAPFGYADKKAALHKVAPRLMAARQLKLQQLWHMRQKPKYLTPAQDRNVAKYLAKGINKAFPTPKPVVHKYLSKAAGEQLVAAAKQDENAEIKRWTPPAQKFVARKAGMRLAMEMEHSLAKENKAGGAYVDKYLHRVTGRPLAGPQKPRYVMAGGNEGEKWYNEQLSTRLEKGLGWEHKQQARKYREEHEKYLNPRQIRALGEYMQPAWKMGKGVAPGLGYAV